ncbi:MAG: tRNA (uridine(54)-C5)-methyltransferase TrmA [Cellvibrionales bacterium]|jgi:tRNA (uracil-5-)-methyltransferase
MPLSRFQPEQYEALLAEKVAQHLPGLQRLGAPEPLVFESPREGFRLRAEFRLWHEGDRLFYAMFDPEAPKKPIAVEKFPIGSGTLQLLMPRLLDRVAATESLRRKLFQVEFLTTLAGEALISLIYHRPLDDIWETEARALGEELGINIVGRSRKQKKVIGRDWVKEELTVAGRTFHYRQPEQAFTQPNGRVNEMMLEWALGQTANFDGDLLELYCGIGNFTLPLAQRFARVLATEVSKVATAAALANRQKNNASNISFARLSAEEMTEALTGKRPFRRLAHLEPPLGDHKLDTLLVDPPRAGLDRATLNLAASFENIIYISCNPNTLRDNLQSLGASHTIEALAFFDQFPYTDHLECGVVLKKRAS